MYNWNPGMGGGNNSGSDGGSGGGYNSSMGGAGALMGMGLGDMFGHWQNPANAAMGTMDQIPGMMQGMYNPYIGAGQGAMGNLQGQYSGLMNNPGQMVNQIGSNYQSSPGFNFQVQQALQGSNHAAAAGGMAGSPEHMQQNMGLATNLANQNYNQYLQNAMGMYGMGLQGEQGMMNQGYNASNELGQSLGNMDISKAMMQYNSAQNQNQHDAGGWGSILGGLGGMIGGGPIGGAVGSWLGSHL